MLRRVEKRTGRTFFDIPGERIDVIALREKSRKNESIKICLDTAQGRGLAGWLELDAAAFKGNVKELPTREDITMPINEQLIVELYSR